jgi:hypothetical protein
LKWRAQAHQLIYAHARRAGISSDAPEMQFFARELFLLSRQCGAAGLKDESRALFHLAREASGGDRNRAQFRVYAAIAQVIGWTNAGKLSRLVDKMR